MKKLTIAIITQLHITVAGISKFKPKLNISLILKELLSA